MAQLPSSCVQGSLRVTDNGSFNVYSKSQEYKFTPDGLTRKGGRKATQPVDNQLSYKVLPCLAMADMQWPPSLDRVFGSSTILGNDVGKHDAQISEKDVRIVKVLGRGASSVVRMLPESCSTTSLQIHHYMQHSVAPRRHDWTMHAAQVYKAFLARCGKFVAIKKINCFERVRSAARLGTSSHACQLLMLRGSQSGRRPCTRNPIPSHPHAMQERRHQMMNDIRALCSVNDPGLVQFIGAYHAPENGQVHAPYLLHACSSLDLPSMRRTHLWVNSNIKSHSSAPSTACRSPSCWSI